MDWRTKYHENSPVISSGKLAKEVQQLCQALPAHQNSPGEKGSRAERTSQEEVFPRVLAAFPVPLPCSSEFRGAKSKPSRTPQKACPHDFHLLCVQQINQLLLQNPGRHHHRSGVLPNVTALLAQSAKVHVQMPKRCRSGEESQGSCPIWNSDPPKVDNLRTEAYWDTKRPPSGCTGCRASRGRRDSLSQYPATHSQLIPTAFSTAKGFLGPGEQDTGSKPLALLPGRAAGVYRAGWGTHKGRAIVSTGARLHPPT